MIEGYFDGNAPMVNIIVGFGQFTQIPAVLLDTGFTGDLQITPELARQLGLEITGVEKMMVANGSIINVQTSFVFVEIEGIKKYIRVLVSDGMSLAGVSLLSRFQYKAIVDCKYKKVTLEKA